MPQKNNMAETVRLLNIVIQKVDRVDERVNSLSTNVDGLFSEVHELKSNVQGLMAGSARIEGDLSILRGQFTDVVSKFIDKSGQIDGLERRVDILESNTH